MIDPTRQGPLLLHSSLIEHAPAPSKLPELVHFAEIVSHCLPNTAPLSCSGHAFACLMNNGQLPEEMRGVLSRATQVTQAYDLFLTRAEGKQVNREMLAGITALMKEFGALQAEFEASRGQGDSALETEFDRELTKLTQKVASLAIAIEGLYHADTVSKDIARHCHMAELLVHYQSDRGVEELSHALFDDLHYLLSLLNKWQAKGGRSQHVTQVSLRNSLMQIVRTLARLGPLDEDDKAKILPILNERIALYRPDSARRPQGLLGRVVAYFTPSEHSMKCVDAEIHQQLMQLFDQFTETSKVCTALGSCREKRGMPKWALFGFSGRVSAKRDVTDEHFAVGRKLSKKSKRAPKRYHDWLLKLAEVQLENQIESLPRAQDKIHEIEGLREELKTMQSDLSLSPSLWKELLQKLDIEQDRAVNRYDLLRFREEMYTFSELMEEDALALRDQMTALGTGGDDLSFEYADKLLAHLEILGQLSLRSEREGLPRASQREMCDVLVKAIASITFIYSEFQDDYREAIEAKASKSQLGLTQFVKSDSPDQMHLHVQAMVQVEIFINLMQEAKRALQTKLSIYEPLASSLLKEGLEKESRKAIALIKEDLEFLERKITSIRNHPNYTTESRAAVHEYLQWLPREEVAMLGADQLPVTGSTWAMRMREKTVERNIWMRDEPHDLPQGWGMKVLRFALWGLYYSNHVHAAANFTTNAYRYWCTGENSLKPYADLLSYSAFARQATSMSEVDQAKAAMEMSMVEGILRGFIPYTASIASEHPAIASYLQEQFHVTSLPAGPLLASSREVDQRMTAQGGSEAHPELSLSDINRHLTHFLGEQVKKHFEVHQQQLPLSLPSIVQIQTESPFFEWLTKHEDAMVEHGPHPSGPLQLISSDLARAIRTHQEGVPLESNDYLADLQEHVTGVFGIPLPKPWIDYLFCQEWTDDRLRFFRGWVERSLAAEAARFMAQQPSSFAKGMMPLRPPLLIAALEVQEKTPQTMAHFEAGSATSGAPHLLPFGGLFQDITEFVVDSIAMVTNALRPPPQISAKDDTKLSKLTAGPDLGIDDQIMLHIMGDPFGRGTELEGLPGIVPLNLLISFLRQKASLERQDLPLLPQLERALHLSKVLKSGTIALSTVLSHQLRSAKVGEPVFLPGGWAGAPSGHAVYYEWMKQPDGRFSFRIYNTGAGLNYHPGATVPFDEMKITFSEQVDIPLENILKDSLLTLIQQLQTIPQKTNWDEQDLYLPIFHLLGGRPSNQQHTSNDLRQIQRSGTCAMASLFTMLSYRFPSQKLLFHTRFELSIKALNEWATRNEPALVGGNEMKLRLMSKSSDEFAMQLIDYHHQGIIDDEELQAAQQLLSKLQFITQKGLDKLHDTIQSGREAALVPCQPVALSSDQPIVAMTALQAEVQPNECSYNAIAIGSWTPSMETLAFDLARFEREMAAALDDRDTRLVLTSMQMVTRKLSFAWLLRQEGLTRETRIQLIHSLSHIFNLAFQARLMIPWQEASMFGVLQPELLRAQAKLYSMIHALASAGEEKERLIPEKSMAVKVITQMLWDYSHLSIFTDPEEDFDWAALRQYWGWNKSQRDFFMDLYGSSIAVFIPQDVREWVYDLIRDPDVQKKLKPHLSEGRTDLEAEFAIALANDREHILPEYLYDILRAQLQMGVTGMFRGVSVPCDSPPITCTQVEKRPSSSYKYHLAFSFEKDSHHYGELLSSNLESIGMVLVRNNDQISDIDLKMVIASPAAFAMDSYYRYRYDDDWQQARNQLDQEGVLNLLIMGRQTPQAPLALPYEDQKAIAFLTCESGLQAREVVRFFMLRPHLLANSDYQRILHALLFQSGILANQVGSLPLFYESALSFFEERYKAAKISGDIDVAQFILRTIDILSRYEDFSVQPLGHECRNRTVDIRKEGGELLAMAKTADQRARSHAVLALSRESKLTTTEEDLVELVAAAVDIGSATSPEAVVRSQRWAVADLIHAQREQLIALTSGPRRNDFLSAIVNRVSGQSHRLTWEPYTTFPLFRTSDGSWTLDVLSGVYTGPQVALIRLSESTCSSQAFRNTIGTESEIVSLRLLGARLVEVETKAGDIYRVQDNPKAQPIIHKKMKAGSAYAWYEYTDSIRFKRLFGDQSGLFLNNSIWCSDKSSEVLIVQPGDVLPSYRIKLDANNRKVVQIERLLENERLLLAKRPIAALKAFEDPALTLQWVSPQAPFKTQKIELPRYRLSFTIKGDRIAADQFPGYFLGYKQSISCFEAYSDFLLLENAQGEQKVLVPKQHFKAAGERTSNLDTRSKGNLDRQQGTFEQSYYEYAIDQTKQRLVPKGDEARYQLAMIYLWHMNYREANTYLRGYQSSTHPFSESETAQIVAIRDLGEISRDASPQALALYGYAQYLLQRNADHFQESAAQKSLIPKNLDLITQYLQVRSKAGTFALTEEEERFLLSHGARTPVERMRLQHLSGDEVLEMERLYSPSSSTSGVRSTTGRGRTHLQSRSYRSFLHCMIMDEGLEWQSKDRSKEALLTRVNPVKDFFVLYQLAKGDWRPGMMSRLYRTLTGVSQVSSNFMSGQAELDDLFTLISFYVESDNEAATLYLLQAIRTNPEAWPSYNELEKAMQASSDQSTSMDIVDTLINTALTAHVTTSLSPVLQTEAPPLGDPKITQVAIHKVPLDFQKCVSSYGTTDLLHPVVPSLETIIQKEPLPAAQRGEASAELQRIFTSPTNDPLLERECGRIAKDLASFDARQASLKPPMRYSVRDPHAVNQLGISLEQQIVQEKESLDAAASRLVRLANREAADPLKRASDQVRLSADGRKPIALDQLLYLFLRRSMEGFHVANDNLSVEEIDALNQEIRNYLVQSTYLQQLRRIAADVSKVQHALDTNAPEAEIQQLLEKLESTATSVRHYRVEEQPTYLVLEHYLNILLRADQTRNLDLLHIVDGVVQDPSKIGNAIESIPGSGKTEVLLPLLLQLCADGDRLCMGILPEKLLPDIAERLAVTLGAGFETSVEVFRFNREPDPTEEELKLLLLRLNQVREGKRVVLTSGTAIQSLYLKMMENWQRYVQNPSDESLAKLELTRNIFSLISTKGLAIIDEADLVLNARKELLFTLGMQQRLQPHEGETVNAIYKTLINPLVVPQLFYDFHHAQEGSTVFSPQAFQSVVVAPLVEYLITTSFGSTKSGIQAFFASLSVADREKVRRYVSGETDALIQSYIASIPNSDVRDVLALTKEEITILLPLTAGKVLDVNYGPSGFSQIHVGIPFGGSNSPSEKSRYGPYETLNYTFQTLLRKGVSHHMISQEIETIRQEALSISQMNQPFEGSSAQCRFFQLTNGDPMITLRNAHEFLDQMAVHINSSEDLKLDMISKYAIPQIEVNPNTLSAHPQLFNFLFRWTSGFTGTLGPEADVFPERLGVIPSDAAMALTLELLWRNSFNRIHQLENMAGTELTDRMVRQTPAYWNAHAIIDSACFGRGVLNEQHAQELLQAFQEVSRTTPVKGVVFYNAEDNLMIWELGAKEAIPLIHSSLKPEERVTFYDQPHVTGSNIAQAAQAIGVVTIGKQSTLRDLVQAAWRMRGLECGQTISFAIDKETSALVTDALKTAFGRVVNPEQITLEHILLFTTFNQAQAQGDNNVRSFKHKINAIMQKVVQDILSDTTIPSSEITDLFEGISSLFLTSNPTSAWEAFGSQYQEVAKIRGVDHIISDTLAGRPFRALATHSHATAKVAPDLLKDTILGLAKTMLPRLPATLSQSSRPYGTENEMEMTKQTTKMQEKQVERHNELRPAKVNWRPERNRWSRHSSYRNPVVTVEQAFREDGDLERYFSVFDSHILLSPNLVHSSEEAYALFNYFHKEPSDILIVETAQGDYDFVIGDLTDGKEWTMEKAAFTENRPAAQYTLRGGLFKQSPVPLDPSKLEQSSQFLQVMTQIKFFAGILDYNEKEIIYLREWISNNSPEPMLELFNRILSWKETTQKRFSHSAIGQLFSELAGVL